MAAGTTIDTHSGDTHSGPIVWLANGDERYGVGPGILALATELESRGYSNHILTFQKGYFHDLCQSQGLKVHCLDMPKVPGISRNPLSRLRAFWAQWSASRRGSLKIAQYLRQIDAQIFNVRWPSQVLLAGRASHQLGIPCYWHMACVISDGYPLGINRKIYHYICRKYGVLPLGNSKYTASTLGEGADCPQVLYLSADTKRFDPQTVESVSRAELGLSDEAIVFGTFARLDPSKGQSRFLKAIAEHVRKGSDVHLVLLGGPTDTEYTAQLLQIAEDYGVSDHLHIVGWKPAPEQYYGLIDIAVNSIIEPESFGLSVVEAMMMERPVLAYALGGPAETVLDGITGWHVAEPTVEAFQAGIERVLSDRGRWKEMGRAARQRAVDNFSYQAHTDHYLEILASLPRNGG